MTLVGTGPSVWVKRLDAKRTDLSTTLDSLFCCLPIGFPGGSDGKMSAYNVGDPGSIPGSGSSSGEGNGNPLQYSCLENPMDRGTWWATVHGVTESET